MRLHSVHRIARIGSRISCATLALALIACGGASGPAKKSASAGVSSERIGVSKLIVPSTAPTACPADSDWNTPAAPRRIFGNTWYVGTCGITAILIVGSEGHVLIDGATEKSGPAILENLRALGIRPQDVRYLLTSHEHHDHVGGMAALQQATNAPVLARTPAVAVLARGASDRSDPQLLELSSFPSVANLRQIEDGEVVRLGDLALTAHATPGHTPGGTSWTWITCKSQRDCRRMAYVDSLTAITDDVYKYSDEAAHPGILAAFRATLDRVAALPCDVLITPHPGASSLWSRLPPEASAPLADAAACRDYAARARVKLDERIANEMQEDTR